VSYAIEAGFDEEWDTTNDLTLFDDELLKSALAIDLFCPVRVNHRRGWKTWLFANRPQLVHEVYLTIARSELSRNLQYVEGLQVLLTDAALSPFLGITTVQLLTEFPNAAMPSLIRL
jgi:phage gp46-like protein